MSDYKLPASYGEAAYDELGNCSIRYRCELRQVDPIAVEARDAEIEKCHSVIKRLDELLWSNTGDTADWPIHIKCDDDKIEELVGLLNEVRDISKEISSVN